MIYTVTFNPAIDYTMAVSVFMLGTVNRSQDEGLSFGGKGINVSLVLKQLGISSTAFGFLAGFTGDAIQEAVTAAGVCSDFIRLDRGLSRINVKIKADKETDLNGSGPDIPPAAVEKLIAKLDTLRQGDILVLAGSIPPSLPDRMYETILARLSGKGILFVVDATNNLLKHVLPYKPFLIKPNHHELGELFGKTIASKDDAAYYAQKLRDMGAQNVLVSMAGDGALLADAAGKVHVVSAPQGIVRNSVGAGDSMVAGFLAGWLQTHDCADALALGTAAGSATAFADGLAKKNDILRLFRNLKNELSQTSR